MNRHLRLLSVFVLLTLGLTMTAWSGAARAQDATPAADEAMSEAGVAFDPISLAMGVDLPSKADVTAIRITIDPGATLPIRADDPSSGMLIVESGAIVVDVDAAWTLTRGDGLLEGLMAAEGSGNVSGVVKEQEAGTAVTLEPGDAAYVPGNVSGELRNDGQEPAVALVFIVGPSEAE
ncbi:MAG: hypothetical protein U0031_02870 [Thermomicrobiales bacterium]